MDDFKLYRDVEENIYIKPNEIFNTYGLPRGNYRIQIDFLNQLKDTQGAGGHYQFIIKQISTSRKEVRLKFLDPVIAPTTIMNVKETIQHITNEFNQGQNNNAFKHILTYGTGNHNPIMNYTFDSITDGGDNQSLILTTTISFS